MISSDTELANLVLSHLGIATEIASLQTERSPEAVAIRRLYDTMRRATLRDFAWPFATKIAALGLVTEYGDATHPTSEWKYAYQQPSDCLMDRKIQSGVRNDTRQTRVPYKITKSAVGPGTLILTDRADAILEYTVDITAVELFTDDFVIAASLRMAMYAAPKLCGADPFGLGRKCADLYRMEISAAKSNAFNEQQQEEDPDSELVNARS